MSRISLGHGRAAQVDDADHEYLSQFSWHYSGGYARSVIDGKPVAMHRLITGAAPGELVDHANSDGLDNRRANLRVCSSRQNCGNRRRSRAKSGFKGVRAYGKRWAATITHGKPRYLGSFETPEEAARAYDQAALEIYGEFAATNASMGLLK